MSSDSPTDGAATITESGESAPELTDAHIGRYTIRHVLGTGGMGVVVAAHDPELDREVAIKIVRIGESEAQAMARLSHPNVVQVYEVIRLGGTHTAIVMELVEGEELGAWQKQRAWRQIVDAYVQASRGLAAAHRAGIVHRDFKPSNAMVDRDGVVRIADFGLAQRASSADVPTRIAGTPVYMAPEQHRRGAVDARTDQWALGCALYEALYGRRPFASAEGAGLADAVGRGDLEDEPTDSPVPRRVRAAIRRALATDPADRFERVEDFAAVLAATPRHLKYLIGATLAIAVVVAIALVSTRDGAAPVCEGLDGPMRVLWTEQVRTDLRARLVAPGVGIPEATVDNSLRGLDAYAASWNTTRTGACMDTHQGVRSAETLDTRMRCLDRRLAAMSGLLDGLATGNAATLRATSDAVAQLSAITECSEPSEIDARPASPELRNEIDTAESGLSRARVLHSLGQFEQVLPLVDRAVAAGEHAAASSLVARALVIRGECEDRLGRYADAHASYQRAARTAAKARDHVVVGDALARAFFIQGDRLGQRAEALRSRPYIELAIESAGQPDALRSEWLHFLAILLYDDVRFVDEAATHERESLAIRRRTLPANHLYIIDSMETLANIEAASKNYDEATRLLHQVLEARVAARGPSDISVSNVYNNLGVVEYRRNDLIAAAGYMQRAVEVSRAAGKPNTQALYNLGMSQLALGRFHAAAESFAISLDGAERVAGKQSRNAAESAVFLAVAWIAEGDFERGRPMLQRGLDDCRVSGSPSLPTALTYAARLALHDGDRARAKALLAEAMKLPSRNPPLRAFVAAEIARAERGCTEARPLLVKALEEAVAGEERLVQSLATMAIAECEIAAGEVRTAQERLEAELAWLSKASADDSASAPVHAALAKLRR